MILDRKITKLRVGIQKLHLVYASEKEAMLAKAEEIQDPESKKEMISGIHEMLANIQKYIIKDQNELNKMEKIKKRRDDALQFEKLASIAPQMEPIQANRIISRL